MSLSTARYILDAVRDGRGQRISAQAIREALSVTGDTKSTFRTTKEQRK